MSHPTETFSQKPEQPAVESPTEAPQPAAAEATQAKPEAEAGSTPAEPSLEQEVQRYRELAMRAQAELENYRKRMVREKEESIRYANAGLLERLLPVLDSFELGLQTARKTPGAEALVQGFSMVEKQLQDFLRESGVDPVPGEGSVFDPNVHEAVSHQPHLEIPEGHVACQIRRGYKLRDRLLRPSTVVVSKGPEGATEAPVKPLTGLSAHA